jgi:hypothetical protein
MRIAPETVVKARELLMHHGVMRDGIDKCVELIFLGQLAEENQVGHFEEAAGLDEVFNRVTAILQYANVSVDVGDAGAAAGGGHEARIVGEQPGFAIQRAHVDHVRPFVAAVNRKVH